MLDLLEPFLNAEGIKFVRCEYWLREILVLFTEQAFRAIDDGSMNPRDREASLNKIKTSASTRVILISFKAGSTGKQGLFVQLIDST